MKNCSYCKLPGHTINVCNDETIIEKIQDVEHTINHLDNEDEIKTYLLNRPLKLLRVLCIPFGVKMSLKKIFYVNLLKRYYTFYANELFERNLSIQPNETDVKLFICNYIKHYLTFMITIGSDSQTIIRFINNINDKISEWYGTFNQQLDIFVGDIWMNSLFVMMNQTLTTNIMNKTIIWRLITRITYSYLINYNSTDNSNELENEYIQPVLYLEEVNPQEELQKEECPICITHQDNSHILVTNCRHSYCGDCIMKTIFMCKNDQKKLSCPLCRCNVTTIKTNNTIVLNKLTNVLNSL